MIKERYLRPENWYYVRFSNKVNFGYSIRLTLYIIHRASCILFAKLRNNIFLIVFKKIKKPNKKSPKKKHYHYLATIGFNFKSDIYFYEVPANNNGENKSKSLY